MVCQFCGETIHAHDPWHARRCDGQQGAVEASEVAANGQPLRCTSPMLTADEIRWDIRTAYTVNAEAELKDPDR
jgi:hypothetical protein